MLDNNVLSEELETKKDKLTGQLKITRNFMIRTGCTGNLLLT
jgi:hypothetical protein